jgi:hypothetical protein
MEIDTRLEALRIEMEAASLWAQLAYLNPSEPQPQPQPAPKEQK